MNKLNRTICNIHFLVLNNQGNSETNIFTNNPKPESELSWIQKLYLEKALHLYKKRIPIVHKKGFIYWETKFTKKIFFKIMPSLEELTLTKNDCNYYMKEYSKVIFKLTNNKKLKKQIDFNDFGCQSHDSITWGVSISDKPLTFYPQSDVGLVKKNIKKRWNSYFVNTKERREFLKIDPKFHFFWRNKLIPAHEVIHNVNKLKTLDNDAICRSEWVASAANLNIYLAYLEAKYNKIKKQKIKKTLQLEAVAAVLYVVELINNININASAKKYKRDIKAINEWVNKGISTDKEYITDIVRAGKPLWRNTYSKHLTALVYAFKFFDNNSADIFTKACIDDSIWSSFDALTKNKFPIDFWNKNTNNMIVSKWITENTPRNIKNEYRFITNPINGKRILVVSKEGQFILNNYLSNIKYFKFKNNMHYKYNE